MTAPAFYRYLALVTAGVTLSLIGLHFLLPEARQHWSLSVVSVLLFMAVCLMMFYAADNAVKSSNKSAFINLVSGSMFGKMVLTMIVLLIYKRVAQPDNQWFVGIFLWSYAVFTIFEVWFMTKIAKK